jgi:hypothetical protein
VIQQWHFVATAHNHKDYLSELGSEFLSSAESSLFISLTSLLKMRSDLPKDLAESGNRFDPQSTIKTTAKTSKCQGLSEFMDKSYPKYKTKPDIGLERF